MGLDVLAVSRLRFVASAVEDPEPYLHLYNEPAFPGHGHPLAKGYYLPGPGSEEHGFRAGSYTGYCLWRCRLAEFALGVRCPTVEDFAALVLDDNTYAGPFTPLLFFSDCDGFIGPRLCKVLAADFADHRAQAEEWARTHPAPEGQIGLMDTYDDWRRGFDLAADNGAVMFG
jgi:hypothetical protein